jgi:ABC-2 type transport system ATP-binding protein
VLFSSHLLPDVEAVCDHVLVLSRGRLLAQGRIQELKQAHKGLYEVRVKADTERFAGRLAAAGCTTEPSDDLLLVQLPPDRTTALFWETAAASGAQIRWLRQRRSSLEEVFLKAVEEHG